MYTNKLIRVHYYEEKSTTILHDNILRSIVNKKDTGKGF